MTKNSTLWDEIADKLQPDGTYHVSRQLMGEIIMELENFRDLRKKGCIVPYMPGISKIAVSYTKGEAEDVPVIHSRKKSK